MQHEYVFSIAEGEAQPLGQVNMSDAGFLERQHLQEWLIANPQIFGGDAMIVTSEFDRWQTSTGSYKKDRLDVLAIDPGGQLIVAELKRDVADKGIDLQALKYAALVSRFDVDGLVDAHRRFLSARSEEPVSEAEARASLEGHVDGPLDADAWAQPQIVLVANSFPEVVTNTVVWLSEGGLDIVLLRYQLYATQSRPLLVVSQIYPVPETEEFLLAPRREEIKQAKERSRERKRGRDVVKILVEHGEPAPGTKLHLQPTSVNEDLRSQVGLWIDDDPSRGEGEWTGEVSNPILWAHTGESGKPSMFATRILEEATGVRRSLAGPQWWYLDDGRNLADLAAELEGPASDTRDWSDLHQILDRIPPGTWTSYGELAELIGTAAQPLGQHLAACSECVNAYRVLTSTGSPAKRFAWGDRSETRTVRKVLESEGVQFGTRGTADREQYLTKDMLADLLADDDSSV